MMLEDAIRRMMTCAPVTGWCPRENECFLVARTLLDYQKTCDSVSGEIKDYGTVEYYAPEVGFFLAQKPEFEFD